jgi:hypothetical protein
MIRCFAAAVHQGTVLLPTYTSGGRPVVGPDRQGTRRMALSTPAEYRGFLLVEAVDERALEKAVRARLSFVYLSLAAYFSSRMRNHNGGPCAEPRRGKPGLEVTNGVCGLCEETRAVRVRVGETGTTEIAEVGVGLAAPLRPAAALGALLAGLGAGHHPTLVGPLFG